MEHIPAFPLPPVTLVLGGARSGKSTHAEKLATGSLHGAPPQAAVYIATAQAGDMEMATRIAAHRTRRGSNWSTVEEPLRLDEALASAAAHGRPVLVDCLTLWLTNVMLGGGDVDEATDDLVRGVRQQRGRVGGRARHAARPRVPRCPGPAQHAHGRAGRPSHFNDRGPSARFEGPTGPNFALNHAMIRLSWPKERFPGAGREPKKEPKTMLDRRSLLAGAAAAVLPIVAPSIAKADAKRQSLVDQSLDTARKVLGGKDFPDAAKLMSKARGVMIVPELVQGGFIIGAAGGRGVLMSRGGPTNWSYPAFYGMGSGSVGFQVGGKVSQIIFIILTEKGLTAILDHKFKFGAEAGVTMVAVGAGIEGGSTAALGTDIVAFANSNGLFAGASLEVSYFDADNDWNALYYGPGATGRAIVQDGRYTNPGAEPLRQFLGKW
jgi:lipid-binding SYLF domain-containing protein